MMAKTLKQIALLCPSVFLICLLVSCKGGKQEEQEDGSARLPVITSLVSEESVVRPTLCRGIVYPLRQTRSAFLTDGQLSAIQAPPGKKVAKGDTLASLTSGILIRQWVQNGLALIEARQNLIELENRLNAGLIAEEEYRKARGRTDALRDVYFSAKSALGKAVLLAPIGGRVIEWYVSPGDMTAAGNPVVLLAELDPIAIARVGLSEREYYQIQEDDSAAVIGLNRLDLPLKGLVVSKGLAEAVTGLPFSADVRFENPGGAIGVGEGVSVTIMGKRSEKAILIPKNAVLDRQDNEGSVFLTDAKGLFAVRRHVVLGPEVGLNVIVDKGVRTGERLIVHGQERLKNGSRVIVVQ